MPPDLGCNLYACISELYLPCLRIRHALTGKRNYDLMAFGNGTLAGLVAITSACSTVYPWSALIIGGVAGVLYCIGSEVGSCLEPLNGPD